MSIISIPFSEIVPNDFPQMLEIRPVVIDELKVSLGGNMRCHVIRALRKKPKKEKDAIIKKQLQKMEPRLDLEKFQRYETALTDLLYSDKLTVKQELGLSDEQKKEFVIKDNLEFGEWDHDILSADWNMEDLFTWGLDPFEPTQEVEEDGYDGGEHYNRIKIAITQEGDQYEFLNSTSGTNHRLRCDDSKDAEAWDKLMLGDLARLVFTDPPYNVDYEGEASNLPTGPEDKTHSHKILNDNVSDEAINELYQMVLQNLYKHSTSDCSLYWWFASSNTMVNRLALQSTGWYVSQQLIWLKDSMVYARGQDYHRQYEPCLFGWKHGHKHFKVRKYCRYKDAFSLDMETFATMMDVLYENRDKRNTYVHPTQKPVRLAERALKKNSTSGDIVVDGFSRSGSTVMACEMMKRHARVMEKDPKFCDVLVVRYASWCEKAGHDFKILRNGKSVKPADFISSN